MLDNFTIYINISAKSFGKNESGEREECALFGANMSIDGSWNTSKTAVPGAYEKNRQEAQADFLKFEESTEGFFKEISPGVGALVDKFKKELEQELSRK